MAAKKSKKTGDIAFANLSLGIPEGHTTIDVKKWVAAKEDTKVVFVIMSEVVLDNSMVNLVRIQFFRKYNDKDVEKLFDRNNGALGTLTNKARVAYALGLIDKTTLRDLGHISRIRNTFAHGVKVKFSAKEVCKLVQKLSTAKGKEVTARNSYEFFAAAVLKCTDYLVEQTNQGITSLITRLKKKKKAKKA